MRNEKHRRFRTAHWLRLTCINAAALALCAVVSTFVVTAQLPRLYITLLAISIGIAMGTLQYRCDLTLAVKDSLIPWILCAASSSALLFWSFSPDGIFAPAIGARAAWATGFGMGTSLLCLMPLRWLSQRSG
ncbi:hypothetical protein AB4059_00465 [Lysobacter sp. 2RAF19]